jgi:hypothetical protein
MDHNSQSAGDLRAQMDRVVATAEAADVLGVKVRQLEDWRLKGRGPRYRKFHRLVRYSLVDLKAFADAGIVEPANPREEVRA